jgi:putative phage-type endonuclease
MTYTILPQFVQDSPEWHAARASGIGASDVGAILGLSPWQTPLGVYRTKMGIPNEIPEDLAYFGHALEAPISQWIADKHPEVGVPGEGFAARSDVWPWLTATPDRCVYLDDLSTIPIELKTSSAYSKDSWADGVPLYYETQVQTQMAVLGAPFGWLAVLHGGNSPELYRVERDDDFIDNHLIPRTQAFWEDHVLARVPPEPTTSAEAVELWPGDSDVTVDGGEALYELWGAYGLMQAEAVAVAERLDGVKLQLQKAMQDATQLTYGGQVLFTWKPRAGARRLDAAALKEAHPALVAEFTKQGEPTRTFLRKKADPK